MKRIYFLDRRDSKKNGSWKVNKYPKQIFKKELEEFGWKAAKISMKNRCVLFEKIRM